MLEAFLGTLQNSDCARRFSSFWRASIVLWEPSGGSPTSLWVHHFPEVFRLDMGLGFVRIVSSASNHNTTDKASVHPGIVFQISVSYLGAGICGDTLRISLENPTLQNTSYFVVEERNQQVQKVVISSTRRDRGNLRYLILLSKCVVLSDWLLTSALKLFEKKTNILYKLDGQDRILNELLH